MPVAVNLILFFLYSAPSACLNAFLLTLNVSRIFSGELLSLNSMFPPFALSASMIVSVNGAIRVL